MIQKTDLMVYIVEGKWVNFFATSIVYIYTA